MLSKLLMGILLLILGYMVWMLLTCKDNTPNAESTSSAASTTAAATTAAGFTNRENFNNVASINYEKFENAPGPVDVVDKAEPAPFKGAADMEESQYAKVNYTGLVDANPEDVLQIEGTDLLTAPLVDNMLYTNSIANTNRNASNDIRGDIPLQFNESYTPFYSSVIYGAPLSERAMTLGSIPQSGPIGPVGPFAKGVTATA